MGNRVRQLVRGAGGFILDNQRSTGFLCGLGLLAAGVSVWSKPSALVIVGGTFMVVSVWPFLRTK